MNIKFLVSQLAQEIQANIFSFDLDYNYMENESCALTEGLLPLEASCQNYLFRFLCDIHYPDIPLLSLLGNDIIYACCAAPDRYFLIGPVRLGLSLTVRHRTDLPDEIPAINLTRATCTLADFLKTILWIQNLCCSHEVSENLILTANCISQNEITALTNSSKTEFSNRENEIRHNSYDQEVRLLSSIEQGDLNLLEQCSLENPAPESLGRMSLNNDRSFKNISISLITLLSRAAIRGGLHPEKAFSLCDSYVIQIEELKNITELQPLVEGAKTTFALLVHDLNESKATGRTLREQSLCASKKGAQRHPYIEKTKDYIYTHLHGKVTLKEAALALDINPNYLSDLFRKYEGISFTKFVMNAKIDLTKNLLTYSHYSYLEIAAYLGFASQSHLGAQFKAATGMTLQQYRNTYSSVDFR